MRRTLSYLKIGGVLIRGFFLNRKELDQHKKFLKLIFSWTLPRLIQNDLDRLSRPLSIYQLLVYMQRWPLQRKHYSPYPQLVLNISLTRALKKKTKVDAELFLTNGPIRALGFWARIWDVVTKSPFLSKNSSWKTNLALPVGFGLNVIPYTDTLCHPTSPWKNLKLSDRSYWVKLFYVVDPAV